MNRTQNSPKGRQEKQLSARRKHWNHMQVTDRSSPDAPSLTQAVIVQMVYSITLSIYHNINLSHYQSTVKPVQSDHPLVQTKAIFVDRWSLFAGSILWCKTKWNGWRRTKMHICHKEDENWPCRETLSCETHKKCPLNVESSPDSNGLSTVSRGLLHCASVINNVQNGKEQKRFFFFLPKRFFALH